FVPMISGITASDFCLDSACRTPESNVLLSSPGGFLFRTDAVGWIYPDPPGSLSNTGSQCVIDGTQYPLFEIGLYRFSPSGSQELIGVFRDRCEASFSRHIRVPQGIALDAINGVLYVTIGLDNYAPCLDCHTSALATVRIAGLPA